MQDRARRSLPGCAGLDTLSSLYIVRRFPMRLRTHRIPAVGGLDVDFEIPPTIMQESMEGQDELEEIFSQPVECHLHLDLLDRKDVVLRGAASTLIRPTCARCGEPFDLPVEVETNLTCSPEHKQKFGTNSYEESRDGLVYFTKEELDLSEIMREQVILALPIRYLCQENCLGLCPQCGNNLNQGACACKQEASTKN